LAGFAYDSVLAEEITMARRFAAGISLLVMACALGVRGTEAQPAFSVAVIHPSSQEVKFERDGKTDLQPGHLVMKDVTVQTCIKWAYGVQRSQVVGSDALEEIHYDIEAKADEPVKEEQLKLMMQTLLAERFGLKFHREKRELKGYAMTVIKPSSKLHPSEGDGTMYRENSAIGTVAKFITMQEFADFMAGPLEAPVQDQTGLKGKYDLVLDFTKYIPMEERAMKPEFTGIIFAAMQGELGLKLQSEKVTVDVLVVDHVEKPSGN
jgi:uncharacterized protein (TIGR03435 family)